MSDGRTRLDCIPTQLHLAIRDNDRLQWNHIQAFILSIHHLQRASIDQSQSRRLTKKLLYDTIHEETTPNQPRFMNRHPDVRRRRRLSTNELVVAVVSARVSLSRVRDDGKIGRDEERVVAETYAVARAPTIESTR